MSKKTTCIKFRISEENKQDISSYCDKYNIKVSEFIREAVFEKMNKLTKQQFIQDKKLYAEVNHIGNNINQIAKRYNSYDFLSDDDKKTMNMKNEEDKEMRYYIYCSKKCHWKEHKNRSFEIVDYQEEKIITLDYVEKKNSNSNSKLISKLKLHEQ